MVVDWVESAEMEAGMVEEMDVVCGVREGRVCTTAEAAMNRTVVVVTVAAMAAEERVAVTAVGAEAGTAAGVGLEVGRGVAREGGDRPCRIRAE